MNKEQNLIAKFSGIETFDPKIILKSNSVCIKPFYGNYPFVTNFVGICIFIYVLFSQNDPLLTIACYAGIGLFAVLIITVLKYYNTVYFDIGEKEVILQPSKFSILDRKRKCFSFNAIEIVTVKSNFSSTGFWGANRRYYIVLLLNDSNEIKTVGSNKPETAMKIAENLNMILRSV